MTNFISVHGLTKNLEKFVFYVDKTLIEAIIPAGKEQAELGYKTTLIMKNGERAYDITEVPSTMIRRLKQQSLRTNEAHETDETETE